MRGGSWTVQLFCSLDPRGRCKTSTCLTRTTFGQILHINSSASVLPEAISPSPASPELHSYWLMSTYFPTSKTMIQILLLWKVRIISQSCEAQNNSWGCHRCQQLSTARRDSWSAWTTTLHSKSCCCSNGGQGLPTNSSSFDKYISETAPCIMPWFSAVVAQSIWDLLGSAASVCRHLFTCPLPPSKDQPQTWRHFNP